MDSNILIYHLSDQFGTAVQQAVLELLEGPVCISVISRIEVLAWKGHTDESRGLAEALMSTFVEIGLDEAVVRATIGIRQSQNVKLPDAIIAGSALVLDLPLVTRNTADFGKVENLRLINPFSQESGQP